MLTDTMHQAQILLPTPDNLSQLQQLLLQGELVAMPTETVYGLAGDATNPAAVAKIYSAKKRPPRNPLIAHYASLEAAAVDVEFNDIAYRLAKAFWPGPLTLVLPQKPDCRVCDLATAGLDTLAVRVPAHPIAHQLLTLCERPLVAPSANLSGQLSPVSAHQVLQSLGERISWIVDGGGCEKGIESTIVDVSTDVPVILRPGSITLTMLRAVVDTVQDFNPTDMHFPKAPGMLYRHYAPACRLRLTTDNPQTGEALLAFGEGPLPQGFDIVLNLSSEGDLEEAAAHLFAYLYQLEQAGVSGIAVMPIPDVDVGVAINERLRKAAESVIPAKAGI